MKLGASAVPIQHWKPEEFLESCWYLVSVGSLKKLFEGISNGRSRVEELNSKSQGQVTRAVLVPSLYIRLL